LPLLEDTLSLLFLELFDFLLLERLLSFFPFFFLSFFFRRFFSLEELSLLSGSELAEELLPLGEPLGCSAAFARNPAMAREPACGDNRFGATGGLGEPRLDGTLRPVRLMPPMTPTPLARPLPMLLAPLPMFVAPMQPWPHEATPATPATFGQDPPAGT